MTAKEFPVNMISAAECAADILYVAEERRPLTITPRWYAPIYHLRKFFPRFVDAVVEADSIFLKNQCTDAHSKLQESLPLYPHVPISSNILLFL